MMNEQNSSGAEFGRIVSPRARPKQPTAIAVVLPDFSREFFVSAAEWESLGFFDVSELQRERVYEATLRRERFRISIAQDLEATSTYFATVDRFGTDATGAQAWTRRELSATLRDEKTPSGALRATLHTLIAQ